MRILIVCHPPLTAELGAAQVALNLAVSLQARGHDVLAWSPEPLSPPARWWDRWRRQRRAIEKFVEQNGPWDVLDLPAISVSSRLAQAGRVVARSFQPEILYLAEDLRAQLRGRSLRTPLHAVHGGLASLAVLQGWRRSPVLLCLGAAERDWMRRRFPRWAHRLRHYVVAPPPAEREALARVRAGRGRATAGAATRFLWIGRWAAHKGTRRLVRFLQERSATHPQDTFTLAGCGSAAERDVPADLVRQGRVRLVPSFRRDELPGLLAAHDAGLFTSSVEGWGLCLNEMLESGLIVYATRAGGVADLEPYWGSRLLPFPPAGTSTPEAREPDLAGYLARFSWPEIARRYEEEVLGALGDSG